VDSLTETLYPWYSVCILYTLCLADLPQPLYLFSCFICLWIIQLFLQSYIPAIWSYCDTSVPYQTLMVVFWYLDRHDVVTIGSDNASICILKIESVADFQFPTICIKRGFPNFLLVRLLKLHLLFWWNAIFLRVYRLVPSMQLAIFRIRCHANLWTTRFDIVNSLA
jgi:hypothetical protein